MAQKKLASGRPKEPSKRPSVPPAVEADVRPKAARRLSKYMAASLSRRDAAFVAAFREMIQGKTFPGVKTEKDDRAVHIHISFEPGSRIEAIESTDVPVLEKVLEIQDQEVISRAIEVIGDQEQAMRWLGTPVRALDYATPISRLHDSEGQAQVLRVLSQLEHGVL